MESSHEIHNVNGVAIVKVIWTSHGGSGEMWTLLDRIMHVTHCLTSEIWHWVEPGQRECRMSACVRLWCLIWKRVQAVMWRSLSIWYCSTRSCVTHSWLLPLDLGLMCSCCNQPSYYGGMPGAVKTRQPAWFIAFFPQYWSIKGSSLTQSGGCWCRQPSVHCSVVEGYSTGIYTTFINDKYSQLVNKCKTNSRITF